jgi:hypothetical protein
MDIYEFIKAEDKRLKDMADKLLDSEAGSPDVRRMLIRQLRIQFGALSMVEGEHFYPALEMYEPTGEFAKKQRGLASDINQTLERLQEADPSEPETKKLIETLHSQIEIYLESKEEALFEEVRKTIPEELAEGLGQAAQQDLNVHRRKLAGELG